MMASGGAAASAVKKRWRRDWATGLAGVEEVTVVEEAGALDEARLIEGGDAGTCRVHALDAGGAVGGEVGKVGDELLVGWGMAEGGGSVGEGDGEDEASGDGCCGQGLLEASGGSAEEIAG